MKTLYVVVFPLALALTLLDIVCNAIFSVVSKLLGVVVLIPVATMYCVLLWKDEYYD